MISDPRRRRERFGSFRDGNGGGAEVSYGNGVQEGAHVGGALGSKRFLELPLRLHPPSSRPGSGRGTLPIAGKHVPLLRNSALTQSITARTQAARRRSRWAMIRYSAVIWGTAGLRSGDVTTGDL